MLFWLVWLDFGVLLFDDMFEVYYNVIFDVVNFNGNLLGFMFKFDVKIGVVDVWILLVWFGIVVDVIVFIVNDVVCKDWE